MRRLAELAAWSVLLAVMAVMCLRTAADRLAGQGLLVRAPALLLTGGQALTARAAQAAAAGDGRTASALSRAALRKRPTDAATLRVAGLAAIEAGELRRGDTLMRLAGAAGWRDAPTQLYWARVALKGGDWNVAAERLDALRRVGAPDEGAGTVLFRQLEQIPAGRTALARRLGVPDSGWIATELARLGGLDAAGIAARFAMATLVRGGLARDELNGVAQGFVDRGRADLAMRLLRLDPRVLGFAPVARPGPFDWLIQGAAGLDAAVLPRRGGLALHVVAQGATLMPVATRLTVLSPGTTRLLIAVEGARTATPLIVTLSCNGHGVVGVEPVGGAWLLRVPGAECATQRLGIAVAGEEARRGADLWLVAPRLVSSAASAP